jgi:hypothetical protein
VILFGLILSDLALAYMDIVDIGYDLYNEAYFLFDEYVDKYKDQIVDLIIESGADKAKDIIIESFISGYGQRVEKYFRS